MEESVQQEFTNNFFCAQDPVLTAQSCLEKGSLREEQRGADELDVVPLQDSGPRDEESDTRDRCNKYYSTGIQGQLGDARWKKDVPSETHGGKKDQDRLCRPTNPIVDLRSLVLNKEFTQPMHSFQSTTLETRSSWKDTLKRDEHGSALSSLPTTTVQARKAALDKRPAQTQKLRTERERRRVEMKRGRGWRRPYSRCGVECRCRRKAVRVSAEWAMALRRSGSWSSVFLMTERGCVRMRDWQTREQVRSNAADGCCRCSAFSVPGEDGVDRDRKRRWARKLRTGTASTMPGGGDADCSFVRAGAVLSGWWCAKRMTPERLLSGGVSQRSFQRR
ncbi:hypothetical protein B0H14DRAFT_3154095 [Mycena olivaceomarginata]|nr:hypothetical protein B0H14DRAFT_3154095 [Mycena olivaceomarginata]